MMYQYQLLLCDAEGTLVIQFSIDSRYNSPAVNAVANLKRRLLSDNSRSRRSVDTTPQLLMSRLDNQTITSTGIYNWTGALFPSSRHDLIHILKKNRNNWTEMVLNTQRNYFAKYDMSTE